MTRRSIPRKILWVFEHANPYNIFLLNSLNRLLPVRSEALYVQEHLPSHPWTRLPERHFEWSEYEHPGRHSARLLQRIVRERDLFVVFNAWRDHTMRLAMWLCRATRHPYVLWTDTPREVGDWTLFERARRLMLRSLTGGAVAILGTGEPARERFTQLKLAIDRFHSLPWIVDLDHFAYAAEERVHRPVRSVTVVQVGRLATNLKGQDVSIDALARLRQTAPQLPLRLVLVGSGPDEAALREQVVSSGLDEQVEFVGWADYDQMPAFLAEADILVQPSRYDPYPVAVIEGMAAGLPILGSTVSGSVRELVRDGIDGFHHDPGDSSALAAQLGRLAGDPVLRRGMGQSARTNIERWGVEYAAALFARLLGVEVTQ